MLTKLSKEQNKNLKVLYDPCIFLLDSSDKYTIERFWGWFLGWEHNPDVVIFYPEHNYFELNQQLSASNADYAKYIQSKELYKKFVLTEKRYYRIKSDNMPKNLRIFVKSEIYEDYILSNGN